MTDVIDFDVKWQHFETEEVRNLHVALHASMIALEQSIVRHMWLLERAKKNSKSDPDPLVEQFEEELLVKKEAWQAAHDTDEQICYLLNIPFHGRKKVWE